MKKSLNGEWKLVYCPNKQYIQNGYQFKSIQDIKNSALDHITSSVPGNLELALHQNGIIEDPFFGANPLAMQEFESYHSWYFCSFDFSNVIGTEVLVFEGIDTFSEIFLNGVLIGKTDNMLIPYEINAAGLKPGENELVVHILPTCIQARSYEHEAATHAMRYTYDSLYVRKAAHSFGWDIMPRIVSSGIWRPVSIIQKALDRIDDAFVFTAAIDTRYHTGVVALTYNLTVSRDSLKGYSIKFSGTCGQSSFASEHNLWHTSGRLDALIENCQFWWPNSMGCANLYDVTVGLYYNGQLLDTKKLFVGVRTVELVRTSTTDLLGNGEFCFYINNEKFFVKGTNWVPVDAFHSRDKERLPRILPMLTDIGCNAVRCWGGNVYEDDMFYDFCDQNGIVIWQDFAMGCGVYPQDSDFCRRLEIEANAIIKRLRNHPSIVLWAGDNECDCAYTWAGSNRNPNTNILTRKVLASAVNRHDPSRPYLPSSPYIDEHAFQSGCEFTPEQHIWGARDYYKGSYYKNTLAHFASEVGYHGCNSRTSIEKFISAENLWPWQDNKEWIIHASSPEIDKNGQFAYRIELMAKQIGELFGEIPEQLDRFWVASQISQAEAMKFFIEMFRIGKWRRTGIIWWNLIDGWPQFSDAVVDYFGEKKLAYHYIKRSQHPVCLMMDEPQNWKLKLVAANDTLSEVQIQYSVTDMSNGMTVMQGKDVIPANSSVPINSTDYTNSIKTVYLITWEYDGQTCTNHYLYGMPAFNFIQYINMMQSCGFDEFDAIKEMFL